MCRIKPKTLFSGFAGFCGRCADFCGMIAGRFGRVVFCFLEILGKSASHRKNISGVTESDRIPNPNALYSI